MAPTRRPVRGRQQDPEEDEDPDGGDDAEIDARINRVVTGRLKRFETTMRELLTGQLKPIQDALAARAQPNEDDDPEEREDPEPDQRRPQRGQRARSDETEELPARQQPQRRSRAGDGRFQRGEDPEVANLKKQLAALDAERKAEKEQLRNRERDGLLTEHLTKAGVDPHRLRGAVAVLRDTLVYDDKEGSWSYRAKRDGFDEDLDVALGVKEWAGTDEGKSYLAPQQPVRGGAGTRVQQAVAGVVAGAARGTDPKAAKAQRDANARAQLVTATNELLGGASAPTG